MIIIIVFWNFKKTPVMLALVLSPIHQFRSPRIHSISILCTIQSHVHVIPESVPFFTIFFTGAIPYHHTNFNPWKFEFNQENSRVTHPKSTTALCHTSFNRMGTPSLALSISWTLALMPFTPHHDTSPFPSNFVSIKASSSNFPSLKTSTTSSLFAVPLIPLKFHVCWVIQGGSWRYLPLRPRLLYFS